MRQRTADAILRMLGESKVAEAKEEQEPIKSVTTTASKDESLARKNAK